MTVQVDGECARGGRVEVEGVVTQKETARVARERRNVRGRSVSLSLVWVQPLFDSCTRKRHTMLAVYILALPPCILDTNASIDWTLAVLSTALNGEPLARFISYISLAVSMGDSWACSVVSTGGLPMASVVGRPPAIRFANFQWPQLLNKLDMRNATDFPRSSIFLTPLARINSRVRSECRDCFGYCWGTSLFSNIHEITWKVDNE